jgi:signal peptidase II
MSLGIADRRVFRLGLIVIFAVIVADQASKAIIMAILEQQPFRTIPVLPVFSLVMAWNPGVSFSMLPHLPPEVLSGFAILVSAGLIFWLSRVDNRLIGLGIGFVAGGALGNVIDRFRFGAVFDFLDFYLPIGGKEWHWPAFNLADSSIFVGVVLLLFDGLFHRVDRAKTEHS